MHPHGDVCGFRHEHLAQLAVGVLLTAALWGASRVGFTRLLRSVRGFLVLFAVMGASTSVSFIPVMCW